MSDKRTKKPIAPLLGLLWCVVVMVAYYVANAGYYDEKISMYGRFFLGFLS